MQTNWYTEQQTFEQRAQQYQQDAQQWRLAALAQSAKPHHLAAVVSALRQHFAASVSLQRSRPAHKTPQIATYQ